MSPRRGLVLALMLLALSLVGAYLLVFRSGVDADLAEGQEAVAAGRPDLAEAAFRRALTADPNNEQAMYGIGWAWHLAGQEDQAREAFNLLREVHPDSPLSHKGLGSVWMAQGNSKEARAAFERALALAGPEYDTVPIENSLALLALSGRDGQAALDAYDALLKAHPDQAEFLIGRAEALLLLARNDEAREAADAAVSHAQNGSVALANALVTRARTLLTISANRVDPAACAATAPPVYAWLEAADHDLDRAEALAAPVPSVLPVRRSIRERRGRVDDACPGVRAMPLPEPEGK